MLSCSLYVRIIQVKRSDDLVDKDAMLEVLRRCRDGILNAKLKAGIGGPIDIASRGLVKTIDDMAGVLTGNRQYFWEWQRPSPDRGETK
jgi:hypothetical protein